MKKATYILLTLSLLTLIGVFFISKKEKNIVQQHISKNEINLEEEDKEMKAVYLENKEAFHYIQRFLFSETKSNLEKISFWNDKGILSFRKDNDTFETDSLERTVKENRELLQYLEKILQSGINYISFSYHEKTNEPVLRFELAHTPQNYRSYINYGNYGFNSQLIENNWYLEVIPNT